jgi:hypothetical protein
MTPHHTFWFFVIHYQLEIYFVLAVMIEQLPPPDDKSGKFYRWFYGVIQILAANFRRAKDATFPTKPTAPSGGTGAGAAS